MHKQSKNLSGVQYPLKLDQILKLYNKSAKFLINGNLNVLTIVFFRDRKTRQLKGYLVDVVNAGEYTLQIVA